MQVNMHVYEEAKFCKYVKTCTVNLQEVFAQ
jgi:hypothetical protein